ncbi:acyltransferase [Natrinema salifodinae]|uniref:Surface polysaccharide O-acyltransferase, integral membrane enzyme n=1 Tax=Natrinema salifodinae TaxID=1202768 RepID=A0A1I0NG75_9EURY|nr:acyltransferase [Natrinema salifodinae]SEW00151.1 Surface polysaccharide O-acyltransferase, integral membrane enzyme [Natrinema salifodinae]
MTNRIHSIDAMRIIAMAFVVSIHTTPFRDLNAYGNIVNFLIESSARFAVPFFFVTAGYFFALKTTRRDPTKYFIKRATTIASIYVFGLALSAPVFLAGAVVRAESENRALASELVLKLAEFGSPLELLYYGNSISEILWFLPALGFSLALIYLFTVTNMTAYLLPVSIGFHLIGLLGASYTMFVDVPFEIRDALFFGFFYTSLGYVIYSSDWQPSSERSTLYLGATVGFGALHLVERYVLGYVFSGETIVQGVYTASYTIATALVTVSLFLFLLSRPNLGKATPLPSWGKYAVGIYVAHPPVLYVLERTGEALLGNGTWSAILWHLGLTPATFFGALLVYLAAHRLGLIEIGGSHLPRLRRRRNTGRSGTGMHPPD